MTGADPPTERVTLAVVDPAELVAVIVYAVEARVAVGVPEITQVEALIDAQAGRAGEVEQDEIAAPLLEIVDGVTVITALTLPLVPVLAA